LKNVYRYNIDDHSVLKFGRLPGMTTSALRNDLGQFSNPISSSSSFSEIDTTRQPQHGERTALLDRGLSSGSVAYGAATADLGEFLLKLAFEVVVRLRIPIDLISGYMVCRSQAEEGHVDV
jgi:hypothetical protein